MGFLNKLLGIGAVAGTTVAAVKVAEKVKANNPDGMNAAEGAEEGAVESKKLFDEVVKAAGEVYQEAAEVVKEKAPEVLNTVKEKAGELKEKAPEILSTVKEKAQQTVGAFKGDFADVVDATAPETAEPAEEAAPSAE